MSGTNETAVTVAPTTAVQKQSEPIGFELANINQAYRLATALSKSGLIPTALKGKPDDILVVLMSGRELGMPPMQSLRHLYVIEGRISMSAVMMLGRVLKSGQADFFTVTETTSKLATAKTRRKGSPDDVVLTFTIEDAMAMNLAGRDNWKKQPATMLRWRVVTALCRLVYPDVVEGIYSEDEAEDIRATAHSIAGLVEVPPASEAPGAIQLADVIPQTTGTQEKIDQVTGEITEGEPEPEKAKATAAKGQKAAGPSGVVF
jgi:hypothetical protein